MVAINHQGLKRLPVAKNAAEEDGEIEFIVALVSVDTSSNMAIATAEFRERIATDVSTGVLEVAKLVWSTEQGDENLCRDQRSVKLYALDVVGREFECRMSHRKSLHSVDTDGVELGQSAR